jgi:hypothetical protein
MSNNTFTGQVVKVTSVKQFNGGFYKCDLILTDSSDKYPQTIPFECVKDFCDEIRSMSLKPGDGVTVSYDLKGREHNGNYYSSIKAWKCDVTSANNATQGSSVTDEEIPF